MGTSWDVAMAVVFLCSAGAGFISGDTLIVDGANWLWKPPVVPSHVMDKLAPKARSKL